MKKALVFAGQGTHKRGMSLHLIADRESRPALACRQIDHNLRVGVLESAGEGFIRYSWRGCVFLWLQVVKDMIRV